VLLSSLIGDTLIMYASLRRGTFRINRFIVSIMQHIAVSDIIYAITVVLPETIAIIANSWILGKMICYVSVIAQYFIYIADLFFIATLATSKYILLKFPRHGTWSTNKAHAVCSIIWFLTLINPAIILALHEDDVNFDFRTYNCNFFATADVWNHLQPVLCLMYYFAPILVIICSTIPTLHYLATARKSARRVRGHAPRQGTLAVTLTAVVFCLSTLPEAVYYAVSIFVQHPERPFQLHLYRIGFFVSLINIMSNFYIYALTIKSFRGFLLTKIKSIVPF
jgi:hypothetical protein